MPKSCFQLRPEQIVCLWLFLLILNKISVATILKIKPKCFIRKNVIYCLIAATSFKLWFQSHSVLWIFTNLLILRYKQRSYFKTNLLLFAMLVSFTVVGFSELIEFSISLGQSCVECNGQTFEDEQRRFGNLASPL